MRKIEANKTQDTGVGEEAINSATHTRRRFFGKAGAASLGASALVLATPQKARASGTNKKVAISSYPQHDSGNAPWQGTGNDTKFVDRSTFGPNHTHIVILESEIMYHKDANGTAQKLPSTPTPKSTYFEGHVKFTAKVYKRTGNPTQSGVPDPDDDPLKIVLPDANNNNENRLFTFDMLVNPAITCYIKWKAKIISDTVVQVSYPNKDKDGADGPSAYDSSRSKIAINPDAAGSNQNNGAIVTAGASVLAAYKESGTGSWKIKLSWTPPTIPKLETEITSGSATLQETTLSCPNFEFGYYITD